MPDIKVRQRPKLEDERPGTCVPSVTVLSRLMRQTPPISLLLVFLFPLSVAPSAPHQDPQRVIQPPLPLQVHTSLTKPKEQMMRPTQTQPSSTQRGDKTTPRKRKSTSSRAALVPVRCPTVDGYYWPYLNATKTVILEVATSLCLFFLRKKKQMCGER